MIELIDKRQENSKTFKLGGGKEQLQVSIGAIHYKDNYADKFEPWKNINLTWVGNRITKAPFELTLDGNKATIRNKKTGEVSTIELLDIDFVDMSVLPAWTYSKGLAKISNIALDTDLELKVENGHVRFTRILKSDKVPTSAKFKVTGNFVVRARDEDGELEIGSSLVNGRLTEEFIPENQHRPIKYPVRIDPTWQVGADTDDCHRRLTPSQWALTGGWEVRAGAASATLYQYGAGMRFTNITIPQAATIDSAILRLRVDRNESATTVNTRISAEDVDDAPTFADDAGAFDTRWANRTTAEVNWDNIGSWVAGQDEDSPDIMTVIQEIIDRPGWNSGQDIVTFWEDYEDRSTHGSPSRWRIAESYGTDSANAPKLIITFIAVFYQAIGAGALGIVGTLSTIKRLFQSVGIGALTMSGTLSATKSFTQAVGAGAITMAGVLGRLIKVGVGAGAITIVGVVGRKISIGVGAGSITIVGSLSSAKGYIQAVGQGAVTMAGTLATMVKVLAQAVWDFFTWA